MAYCNAMRRLQGLRDAAEKEVAVNEALVAALRGTPVLYGQCVQLQHVKSGKVRIVSKSNQMPFRVR